MPNHIKNRITLIGSAEAVKQAIEKFSTHYPETVMIAFDGEHVVLIKARPYMLIIREQKAFLVS